MLAMNNSVRPEGNVTGTTFMGALSTTKEFQLAHELVPAAKTAGFLMNPDIVIFFRLHATERTSTMHSGR
jgi:ABC-type uncharacterized transport system substrate-binding protein